MPATSIDELEIPAAWLEYGVEAYAQANALVASGVMTAIPGLSLPDGGSVLSIPFFQQLAGDADDMADGPALDISSISAAKQAAVVMFRGRLWGVDDMAAALSGSDPAGAIVSMLVNYWAAQDQKDVIASLNGQFADALSGLVLDISGLSGALANVTYPALMDAAQLLGDAKGRLSVIAMHSATENALAKANIIDYQQGSTVLNRVGFIGDKRVIVDDTLPLVGGVYTTYLMAAGAIAYQTEAIGPSPVEINRDTEAGVDLIAMRSKRLIHTNGLRWVGTLGGQSPTRAELATDANWELAFDPKNVGVVALKHKVGAA